MVLHCPCRTGYQYVQIIDCVEVTIHLNCTVTFPFSDAFQLCCFSPIRGLASLSESALHCTNTIQSEFNFLSTIWVVPQANLCPITWYNKHILKLLLLIQIYHCPLVTVRQRAWEAWLNLISVTLIAIILDQNLVSS